MLKTLSIWITGHDLRKGSNGIGPNSWGMWRLLIPFQGRFYNQGLLHDIAYCWGTTEKDREEADNEFLKGCVKASGRNIFAIFASCVYYIGVDKFGHNYFNYHKQK